MTKSRPLLPFIVIDQSALRSERRIQEAFDRCARKDLLILLPDAAILEMLKSDQWEYTARRSLEWLSVKPHLVAIAHGTGELIRREEITGEPHIDIVDHEVTSQIRSFFQEVRSGSGPTLDLLRSTVPGVVASEKNKFLDGEKNRKKIIRIYEAWKKELKPAQIKDIRGKGSRPEAYAREFKDLLASTAATQTCITALSGAGYREEAAKWLSIVPSVSSHLFLCMAGLALKWLGQGGLEGLQGSKATNEIVDLEYIVPASLCCDLISEEHAVMETYFLIQEVVELRWQRLCQIAEYPTGSDDEQPLK